MTGLSVRARITRGVSVTAVIVAVGVLVVIYFAFPRIVEEASPLLIAVAAIIVIVVVASIIGGRIVARSALVPITQLQQSAEDLAISSDTDEYLPVSDSADEIAGLTRTVNGLVERLRGAIAGERSATRRERQVISDASHEVRTPLAILQAQLQVATDPAADPEAVRRDLRAAQTTVRRLASITQSLLDLSRVQAQTEPGDSAVSSVVDELPERIERARMRVAERADDAVIELDFDVEVSDEYQHLQIATADFGRIVDNLIDNAIGAAGDRPAKIHATLRQVTDGLLLEVADDCGGMDPEFIERAFERFSRGQTSSYLGSGLGLPIVRHTTELAGGTIKLDNRPGIGLTVIINLPFAQSTQVNRWN